MSNDFKQFQKQKNDCCEIMLLKKWDAVSEIDLSYSNVTHWKCQHCYDQFSNIYEMIEHQRTTDHDELSPIPILSPEFLHAAGIKGNFTEREKALLERYKEYKHRRDFFENEVRVESVIEFSLIELTRYMNRRKIRADSKVFFCNKVGCNFKTDTSGGLHYHCQKEHTNYQCEYCFEKFINEPNYTRHIKDVHLEMNYFVCPLCSSTFSDEGVATIKKHMKLCSGKTKIQSNNHVARKTRLLGNYLAYCRINSCTKIFTNTTYRKAIDQRTAHESRHGNDDFYQCIYCKSDFQEFVDLKDHVNRCGRLRCKPWAAKMVTASSDGKYHIYV